MIYDAIVIGTGPAGSTAAYELSRRGLKALALEKRRHPRYKVCGGGLSVRVDRLLGIEYHCALEATINRLVVSDRGRRSIEVRFEEPIAYMVMRDRFDAYLADRARRSGCDFREEEPAVRIRGEDGLVRVKTTRGEYEAETLIGADGLPSLVVRDLFPEGQPPSGLGLEGEAPPAMETSWSGESVLIDLGAIRYGYGWIFPKKGHLSCGVGSFRRNLQDIRQVYSRFSESQAALAAIGEHRTAGHLIPVFSRRFRPLTRGRAVLVGDAAGLVDPFLGEGLYYAIRSGQMAAEAVAAFLSVGRPLTSYQDAIRSEIHSELESAFRIASLVYRFPRIFFGLSKRFPQWHVEYARVLQGRSSYQAFWRRCLDPRTWLRLLRSASPS